MLEQTVSFFLSWFANPSALGIGLAVVFGAVWLVRLLATPLQETLALGGSYR